MQPRFVVFAWLTVACSPAAPRPVPSKPVVAVAPAGKSDDPPDAPAARAGAPPDVRVESVTCDVWGGDGDGVPAIWTLHLTARVTNPDDEPWTIEHVRWTVESPSLTVENEEKRDVAANGSLEVTAKSRLSLSALRQLRESGSLSVEVELSVRGESGVTTRSARAEIHPEHC